MKASFILLALVFAALALAPGRSYASPGWELVLDRPTPNFGGIDFTSANDGWMTAGGGLLHTTDGGATWSEAAKLSGNDVDFADAEHGWLVGLSGSIYSTGDGGRTWEAQASGTDVHLTDVVAISASETWAVGYGEGFSDVIKPEHPTALLHTTDGGATWQRVETPPHSWFSELSFVGPNGWALGNGCTPPPDTEYCAGSSVAVYRTNDAGATWTLLQPNLPTNVHSLTLVDSTHGWLGTSSCTEPANCIIGVYRTADGGSTWTLGEIDALGLVWGLAFRDTATGWAVEQDCPAANRCTAGTPIVRIMRTDDGGISWRQVGSLRLPSALQTPFSLALHGRTLYLTGIGVAYRSVDDGTSWQTMEHPAVSFDSNADFVDRDTGFAMSRADLLRTNDAGRNWKRAGSIPAGAQFFIRFLDANVGFTPGRTCDALSACATKLWRTSDGGSTWQPVLATADENAYVLDIRFVTQQRGLAAFSTGIAVSDDAGLSWTFQPAPPGWSLAEFAAADASDLWAVFETVQYPFTYELRRSIDEGRTWQTVQALPGYTSPLVFVDRDYGWYVDYVCANSCTARLYATIDGGATWHEQHFGAGSPNDLTFLDPLNGWANTSCGSLNCPGTILHTADGGATWTTQLVGDLLVGQFDFVDLEHGWLALSQYRGLGIGGGPPNRTLLYHTSDGGGGPIAVEPKPTISFPDVGFAAGQSGGPWQFALALAALGALAIGGALATRRR